MPISTWTRSTSPPTSPRRSAGARGAATAPELIARLKEGALRPEDCPDLTPGKRYALSLALRAQEILPPVQSLELPRPVSPDLFEINDPGPDAPVLVTGNSEFTLTVLTGLLALTVSPFYLLLVDTRGDTADMAMIYRSFTPQRLDQALEAHKLADRVQPPPPHHSRGAGAPAGGIGRLPHRLDHPAGPHLRRGTAPVPGG